MLTEPNRCASGAISAERALRRYTDVAATMSAPLHPPAATLAVAAVMALSSAHADELVRADLVGLDPTLAEAIAAELPQRDRPTTALLADRLSAEAADLVREALRTRGYYGADVKARADTQALRARVEISLGPQFHFAGVDVAFEGAAPMPAAIEAVRVAVALPHGAPAQAAKVLAAERDGLNALRAAGYPDAEVAARDVVVDHADQSMRVTFRYAAGAGARFGVVRAQPSDALRDDVLQAVSEIEPGSPYRPEPMAALRRHLLASGAFADVQPQLAPPAPDGETRDVIVTMTPAHPRTWEVGAGWSTTEGVGVDVAQTQRNVSGRADALTVSASLSEQQQRAEAAWTLPFGGGRDRAWRLGVAAERDISGPFERVGVKVSALQDAQARRELGVSIGAVVAADVFTRSQGIEQALVFSGYLDARRDDTDDPLDAREGGVLQARLEPSISTGDATTGFVRAVAEARGYQSLDADRRFTVAGRVKAGWVEPVFGDADAIPPDRRFYAGGGGSVRGYAFNSIFPEIAADAAPGGRGLMEVGVELRGRFDDRLGAAVFVDGGTAFNALDEAGDLRWGAGVGLRYDLGFAPLRIDIATPLDRRDGDEAVSIYVSIGQAF